MPTYLFENHTNGEFILPKRTASGIGRVPPGARIVASEELTQFVPQFLRIIRVIESNQNASQDKLILDQPPTITVDGTTEYVVQTQQISLNEKAGHDNTDVVLLNETPLSGVEIL